MSGADTSDTPTPETVDLVLSSAVLPALQADPPDPPPGLVLLPVTRILWARGLISPAISGIRLLEQREEADADALHKLGCWLLHLGDLDEAKATLERALSLQPDEQLLHLAYAHALFYLGHYDRAAREFGALAAANSGLNSPPKMAEAAARFARGERSEEIVLSPLPGLPQGLSEMLQIHFLHGPVAACRRLPPATAPVDATSLPHRRLEAEYLLEQDRDEEALHLVELVLGSFPWDPGALLLKGFAARRLGLADDSHNAFQDAAFAGPLEARAWAGAGAGFLERGDWEQAWRYLRIATFLSDDNPHFWGDLGMCESQRNRPREAEEAISKAIDLGAHTFENYLNRGLLRIQVGNVGKGALDLRKAVAIQPQHPRALEIRTLLASPRGDNRFVFGPLS